ncbi:hypothetical protein [Promicromonospora sp. NFX87]|uniref:hypothetical protein n=1 Tax=Promicromonospora sp. NFX87 TaxID=3402691 RepID=UPI003AFB360D
MNESKLANYLAKLPYTIGHQLSDQDVVVGAYDSGGKTVAHAAIDWSDGHGDEHEFAEQTAGHLAGAFRKLPVARLVVIAYGPDGPARSRVMADAVEDAIGLSSSIQIHVHDGHGRVRNNTTGEWGRAVAVTGVVPQAALDGLPAPAASRTELLESVAPLPTPLFGPLDPGLATKIRGSSPLMQAETAQRALDALASSRVDDLQQMTVLSHLITTAALTRDTVLVHAIRDNGLMDARTDALVRTFRAAPSEQRPQLASTAAAAIFLAARPAPIVHGLLRHADKDADLTTLVSQAVRLGIDPRPMGPVLAQDVNQRLAEAETAWSAQRSTAGPGNGKTSIAPRTPPSAPTSHMDAATLDSEAGPREL